MPQAKPVEVKKSLTPDVQLTCVRFSPCGSILAAAAFDGTIRRWDVTAAEPTELPRLPGHNGWVTHLAFHPDRKRLFSGDSWGKIACWDYSAKGQKNRWEVPVAHDGWVRKLAVSPDGKTLVSVGRDGFARLWAIDTATTRSAIAAKEDLLAVAYHPFGSLLTGDLRGVVTQWNASGKPLRTFDASELYKLDRIQDVGGVRCLAFDTAGKTLFVGGCIPKTGGFVQGTPLLLAFDWTTGKQVHAWKGATDAEGFVHDLCWHQAGFLMGVTSGQPGQGKLHFWTPGETAPFFTASKPNCHSLDLHPDGKRLAVSATNANSSGNGRVKGKGGEYPANVSPIHFWTLPA